MHLFAETSEHILSVSNQHSIMSNPNTAKLRRIVLTGSIAAITATGAWYGAGLKVQQERNEVSRNRDSSSLIPY
jgi:predicted secreted protein